MGYAIELYFDKESEQLFFDYWKSLHENNISSYMYQCGGKPHIALAVFDDNINELLLEELFKEFFNLQKKFRLLFSSLGVFPGNEGVSFIAPKVTNELLYIHKCLYELICRSNLKEHYWDYYKPQFWIPHCTMTIKTSEEKQMEGLALINKQFNPRKVIIDSVTLVKFSPVHQLDEIKLK